MTAKKFLALIKNVAEITVAGYPITSAVMIGNRISLRSSSLEPEHPNATAFASTIANIEKLCADAPLATHVTFHSQTITGILGKGGGTPLQQPTLHLRCRSALHLTQREGEDCLVFFSRMVDKLSLE